MAINGTFSIRPSLKCISNFDWKNIKSVSQWVLDSYATSDFYNEDEDTKIYKVVELDAAKGIALKRLVNMMWGQFMEKGYSGHYVFQINSAEANFYGNGGDIAPQDLVNAKNESTTSPTLISTVSAPVSIPSPTAIISINPNSVAPTTNAPTGVGQGNYKVDFILHPHSSTGWRYQLKVWGSVIDIFYNFTSSGAWDGDRWIKIDGPGGMVWITAPFGVGSVYYEWTYDEPHNKGIKGSGTFVLPFVYTPIPTPIITPTPTSTPIPTPKCSPLPWCLRVIMREGIIL